MRTIFSVFSARLLEWLDCLEKVAVGNSAFFFQSNAETKHQCLSENSWYCRTRMLKSQSQVHAQLLCCHTPFMNTVIEVIYLSFWIVYISTITKNDSPLRTCEPWQYAFQHSTFSRVEKWTPLFEYLLHTHPRFGLMFPLHIPEAKRRSLCEKMKTFRLCSDNNERTEWCVGMSETLKCMYETIKKYAEGNYTY
jgi:hypothetical protein